MKIDLGWLKRHPHETTQLHLEGQMEDINLAGEEIRFRDKVLVQLHLTNTGRVMVGSGTIRTVLQLQCGRCLQPYTLPVETDFNFHLREDDGVPVAGGDEDDSVVFHDNEVDLAPLILENLIVNLPMKRVCREGCRGLCPRCGADLNHEECRCREEETDPRWDALKKLL